MVSGLGFRRLIHACRQHDSLLSALCCRTAVKCDRVPCFDTGS